MPAGRAVLTVIPCYAGLLQSPTGHRPLYTYGLFEPSPMTEADMYPLAARHLSQIIMIMIMMIMVVIMIAMIMITMMMIIMMMMMIMMMILRDLWSVGQQIYYVVSTHVY